MSRTLSRTCFSTDGEKMTTRLIEGCLTLDEICDEIQKSYPVVMIVDNEIGRGLARKLAGPHRPGELIKLTKEEFEHLRKNTAILNWRR